ncbi:helix-turn-helix transcriptional regulator [Streptomyces sp. NBC_00885]|uniref:helix-turn-helix domain-containing protein n=1 Tax=Streptomyces sp. NBC_00885 TaxID=2975857 RepID=UPI0038692261|nr:helix-turn-helix transcriptional regulator [Streptomyces sp. NBC_00885]
MSSQPARPPTTLLSLTPGQARIAEKVADGRSTDQIASDLGIAIGTVSAHLGHCGRKLGVSGRAPLVHACYVTEQIPRPDLATPPGTFSDVETWTWRMVATGASAQDMAEQATITHDDALRRIRSLRECVEARNAPHLVTLGWAYAVLDASLTDMTSGVILPVPARR